MSEFNEDEEWSLEDYQRQLLQMCENEALKRAREEGFIKAIARGMAKKSRENTMKFFKKKYPNEDIKWLENLTEKQYDEIFDKLLNDESLDEIKKIIEK